MGLKRKCCRLTLAWAMGKVPGWHECSQGPKYWAEFLSNQIISISGAIFSDIRPFLNKKFASSLHKWCRYTRNITHLMQNNTPIFRAVKKCAAFVETPHEPSHVIGQVLHCNNQVSCPSAWCAWSCSSWTSVRKPRK